MIRLVFALFVAALALVTRARAEPSPLDAPFDLAAAIASGSPMTAERAAQRAAEVAPSVEQAAAFARAAEAAVTRTRDQLLPRLELVARYVHVDGFPDGRIELGRDDEALAAGRMLAAQISDPASRALWLQSLQQPTTQSIKIPRDQFGLSARISWPLSDLFFSILPALRASEAGARVRRAEERARLARVRLSARESYYQLVRARGTLAVAERARLQADLSRERIDAAVRSGMRAPADGATAAARVAQAEQAVAAAEAGVDIADAALRTLLRDPDGATYGVAEVIVERELPDEPRATSALVERARATRPELIALAESMQGQRTLARVHEAAGYPHLSVYAGGDYARPNRYVIPPNFTFRPSWEVGATLSYAPNDTLSSARRASEDRAELDALLAQRAELERALLLEVRTAYAARMRSQRTREAARAAELAATRAYEQRLAELRAGEVTLADLFVAESELNRARLDVLEAAVEQLLAHDRLAYAIGE